MEEGCSSLKNRHRRKIQWLLSYSAYVSHKALFYNEATGQWTIAAVLRRNLEDSEVFLFLSDADIDAFLAPMAFLPAHSPMLTRGYTAPVIVSFVCLVVIFYGGAFIGVILVDYGLDPYHWIYKHAAKTRKETADHADNDEIDEPLINTHNSKCSKKRPSLMKVITGRYLRDIMKEYLPPNTSSETEMEVLSSNAIPNQKRTAENWKVHKLADVEICEGNTEQIRYRRYCWHLFTISIFYALPAFQLILTYQQLLNTTGNQDICYYNYLCSHKLGVVSAFNNVWSNIGYIALGILFILLAFRRQIKYHAIQDYNMRVNDLSSRTGVPQHFGIYYTIGVALVAEGFLSAFYHVCPNDTNFQFDTAFMFIIAGMGIYQIFHNRHSEFGPNAHILYLSFALLIIVSFFGTLLPSAGFWIVMTMLHLLWTVFVSFQFYYNGVIKFGNLTVVRELLRSDCRQFPSKPCNPTKFTYVVLLNIVNIALAIYGLASYFTSQINFNSFVLTVMLVNLTLYLTYYVIVKCIHKENNCHHQNAPPKLFLFLIIALLCWIPAVFFFIRGESDWTMSPARSRDGNTDCLLMGFFNSHDIWHFLSAIALFFSLLMLMSLDDNQEHVVRKNILVF